jgi:U3 small nucleolar RNA-associated protein 20
MCSNPLIDELKTLALEVQDLLQTKVGTTKFAAVYSRIRQHVQQVRHERRTNRAQQLATNPEAAHKRKIRKNTLKTEGKKRKNRMFAYVSSVAPEYNASLTVNL